MNHGSVDANGITIHYVEEGDGPLVVLCHGFPESWYSWRHQLPALAEGFRAVAMSMRGYGDTTAPSDVELYAMPYLVSADRRVARWHDARRPDAARTSNCSTGRVIGSNRRGRTRSTRPWSHSCAVSTTDAFAGSTSYWR